MTETDSNNLSETDEIEAQRDAILEQVADQIGDMAEGFYRIDGSSYGTLNVPVDGGKWTLKQEDGSVSYLRFESEAGNRIYVLTEREPPSPDALLQAMEHYPALIEGFNDWIDRLTEDIADLVETVRSTPAVESVDTLTGKRDDVADEIRTLGNAVADAVRQIGDRRYGTFKASIGEKTWELKYDKDSVEYLRVGGRRGTYLISKYDPPSPSSLKKYAPELPAFVEAVNGYVEKNGDAVSLSVTVEDDA